MKKNPKQPLNSYARYSSMAVQMIVVILAGVFGGRWIDKSVAWPVPVFTLLLSLLSVAFAIYLVMRDLNRKK
ncbi:MAG: AtpZ/AtpI family protein [Bacteroidota bacterium]